MARIIGLVQLKGGTGRSTLAVNLAGELAQAHTVALIDTDAPQSTAYAWAALRQQNGLVSATAANHRALLDLVERHRRHDFLILDGPPRLAEMARAILALSDLVLVPIGASPAEVWATQDLLPLIEEAGKRSAARIVWTRVRAHLALTQMLIREADKALGLRSLKSRIGHRVAYVEALGSGRTAAELSDPVARLEVQALAAEVNKHLRQYRSS